MRKDAGQTWESESHLHYEDEDAVQEQTLHLALRENLVPQFTLIFNALDLPGIVQVHEGDESDGI